MLNILWPIFIILSFIYALVTGKVNEVNNGIFESLSDAIELSLTFLGTICLWNGIMKIIEKTSLIEKLKKLLKPVLKLLFPRIHEDEEAYNEISMNVVANVMGLRECRYSRRIKSDEITAKKK